VPLLSTGEFAESVLRGVKSFSLRDEAILGELAEEKNYVATMEGTHRILGGEYEPSIEEYTPRERLALAWFITNPAKGWEEIFKEKQFALQDVKVVILEKEVAKLAGFPEERIKDGVFGDADTGCIIIINREWDKLELLLRLEKARAKLEIFTRVAQRLKGKNFGENLVTFHNQWAGYKEDIWHRQIRPVLEGKEQALIFEYMEELFRAIKKEEMGKPVSKRRLSKEELKNLIKLLEEFKQCYAFPERLPDDLFNKKEAKNFVLYNFVLKFIEYSEIAQIKGILKRGESLKVNNAEDFLDELLCTYSTKLNLGKNIWRAISEYTKEIRDKGERTFSERLIDWVDEKILSPKVILSLTLLTLIAIAIYRWGLFLPGNLSLITAGLSLAMVSMVRGEEKRRVKEEVEKFEEWKEKLLIREQDFKYMLGLRQGLSQREISEIFGIPLGSLTHSIVRLAKFGLRENKRLKLSKKGEELLEHLAEGTLTLDTAWKLGVSRWVEIEGKGIMLREDTPFSDLNEFLDEYHLLLEGIERIKTKPYQELSERRLKVFCFYYLGIPVKDITRLLDIGQGLVSAYLNDLKEKGVIRKKSEISYELTEEGKEWISAIREKRSPLIDKELEEKIGMVLEETGGNISDTARRLGMTRGELRGIIRRNAQLQETVERSRIEREKVVRF